MSFAPNTQTTDPTRAGRLFADPSIYMREAMRRRGINVDNNWLAKMQLGRASELVPMAYAYGAGPNNFEDFVNQYTNQMNMPGSGGQFSQGNISSRVNSLINGSRDPDNAAYNWLIGGGEGENNDPELQYNRFKGLQELTRRDWLPGFASSQSGIEKRKFQDWYDQTLLRGPESGPSTWLEAFTGRGSAASPYAAPGAGSPPGYGAPSTTPPPSAAPGYGSTPGDTGSAQATQQTATAPQFNTWQDVINYMMQGHDQRNLMTEGMRDPGRGFSFGGITYDPTKQQGSGRTDRDPTKRFGGGAGWTGMIYRLQQLMKQRDAERAGGTDYPAVSGEMTDDQLARLASDWVNSRWRGTTGISY